jgi:dolichol-phosphate mannosyltransferase
VPGWTSLTIIVLMLGGVQMITVGVIGEYLGRLYMQSKARPLFIVEEILRAPDLPTRSVKRTREREVADEHAG